MHWLSTLYVAVLFLILTPGIVLRLPPSGDKITVAVVHALVFAAVWHFTHKFVYNYGGSMGI
jgi:hypothetical protein